LLQEIQDLQAREDRLSDKINELGSVLSQKTSEVDEKIKVETEKLSFALEQTRLSNKVRLDADVAAATRKKFAIERQVLERQAELKALAAEESDLKSQIYRNKEQLKEIQAQLEAIKKKI
jgi:chromosome segregation ATPase